jgi:hypothetical protein
MPCLTDKDGKIIVCLDTQEDIDRALVHTGQGEELLDNFVQLIRSMANMRGGTAVTYRVLITDEYGHTDVLADGFATREHAERFMNGVKRYICHPENVRLSIEEVPYDRLNLQPDSAGQPSQSRLSAPEQK